MTLHCQYLNECFVCMLCYFILILVMYGFVRFIRKVKKYYCFVVICRADIF